MCRFLAVWGTGYWLAGDLHKMQAFAYSSLKACVVGASLAPQKGTAASGTVGDWICRCVGYCAVWREVLCLLLWPFHWHRTQPCTCWFVSQPTQCLMQPDDSPDCMLHRTSDIMICNMISPIFQSSRRAFWQKPNTLQQHQTIADKRRFCKSINAYARCPSWRICCPHLQSPSWQSQCAKDSDSGPA